MHKESCDGHLRKVGMAHLDKAGSFHLQHNWSQLLRYSDLAATKLKQLKDRPLEDISTALGLKSSALDFLGRPREQLECTKEWYCLWNTKPTDVGAIQAALALILSCLGNKEYADAKLYASTIFEIINHKHDNRIPEDERQIYVAHGAYHLALATLRWAQFVCSSRAEKEKGRQEAIELTRRAIDMHTQLYGIDSDLVANDTILLADALHYLFGDEDDEVIHHYERAKAIYARVQGSSSENVGLSLGKLAHAYYGRASRARNANDRTREQKNLELALLQYREHNRIYLAVGRVEEVNSVAEKVSDVEQRLRQFAIARATSSSATKG